MNDLPTRLEKIVSKLNREREELVNELESERDKLNKLESERQKLMDRVHELELQRVSLIADKAALTNALIDLKSAADTFYADFRVWREESNLPSLKNRAKGLAEITIERDRLLADNKKLVEAKIGGDAPEFYEFFQKYRNESIERLCSLWPGFAKDGD